MRGVAMRWLRAVASALLAGLLLASAAAEVGAQRHPRVGLRLRERLEPLLGDEAPPPPTTPPEIEP